MNDPATSSEVFTYFVVLLGTLFVIIVKVLEALQGIDAKLDKLAKDGRKG